MARIKGPTTGDLSREILRLTHLMITDGKYGASFSESYIQNERIKRAIRPFIATWLIPPLELLNEKLNKKGAKK